MYICLFPAREVPENQRFKENRMKIVIVGNGKIGHLLVEQLAKEGHDIVVIDTTFEKLHYTQEKLDVAIVVGNGASVDVLKEAGTEDCDLLLAVTNSDEVNLLTALLGRKIGAKNTVARVRNRDYDREMNLLNTSFGLSFSINPEKTAAREIFRLLQFPSFLTRSSFAGGRAELVELMAQEGGILEGKRLDQLPAILNKKALICTIERDNEVIVPSGSFVIQAEDKMSFSSATADLPFLLRKLNIKTQNIKNVLIIGGSTTAFYLANYLKRVGIGVTIMEMDKDRCEKLCELLPEADIICADGSKQSILNEEGISKVDAVIPLTGYDEVNIMISLYAKSIGVKKTVTKVNRLEYLSLVDTTELDAIVSPKSLTANEIVRYVRAVSQSRDGSVETLSTINNGRAEALGFTVPETGFFLNVPLRDLKLKKAVLIASIVRNEQVIIPDGNTCLMRGDSIIVIADPRRMISNLTDIFLDNGGNA